MLYNRAVRIYESGNLCRRSAEDIVQKKVLTHRDAVSYLRVRKAAHISMAPQKETSPSP